MSYWLEKLRKVVDGSRVTYNMQRGRQSPNALLSSHRNHYLLDMTSLPPLQDLYTGSSRSSLRPLKPKAPDIMQTEPGPSPHRLLFPISTDRPIIHAHALREKSKSSSRRKTDEEHEIEELKQLLFVKSEEMLRRDLENLRETGKMKRENDRLSAENTALKDELRRLKVELHRTRQLRDPVSFFEQKLSIKHPPPLHSMYAPRRSIDREVIEVRASCATSRGYH